MVSFMKRSSKYACTIYLLKKITTFCFVITLSRCEETKKALKAIDMDEVGTVDWNEFALYLKWAGRQYPDVKDAEDLLSTAFRKGLVPAMQDEVIKQPDFPTDEMSEEGDDDFYPDFEDDDDFDFMGDDE